MMPTLTSLKRSARGFVGEGRGTPGAGGEGQDSDSGCGIAGSGPNEAGEKSRRGSTKRAFLRGLITTSKAKLGSRRALDANDGGSSDESNSGSNRSGHDAERATTRTFSSISPLSETPQSPRSTLNSSKHKPLPSPPPPGTVDKADGKPRRPVLKLNRIMATLNDTEIEKLFSGAPQFFARSHGHGSGAPHPSVAFPLNEELTIRDLTDHTQIEDDAWGCVTAIPRLIQRDPLSAPSPTVKTRPHFNSRCRERPGMLSMHGLEKGTIGYQAALELSVADSLQEEQYGFHSLGSKAPVIIEQRQRLITSKDALRHLDDASIMEQLLKVERRYHSGQTSWRNKSQDLYNDLFRRVLHPPTRVIDTKDPYSLAVQIHALVKVLAASNAWIDFSHVEWRIRLGQILWGFPLDDEVSDGSSIDDGSDAQDRSEERYWLLLQILLACELLTRLDAITEGEDVITHMLKQSDVHKFEKEANISVRWSLILARSWLENITISKTSATSSESSMPKGWLTALTSKMNLKHEHMHGAHYTDHTQHRHNTTAEDLYTIKGRYPERQVKGLLHFARKLRWPGLDVSATKLSENAATLSKGTPINTPMPTSDTRRSSYFGSDQASVSKSTQLVRRRKIDAALHPSGWLSKSYISGLILPGEALSHFLMSTLLENDNEAITRLGPTAHLCGGFVYSGKSFWSTACIVGRVLAAGKGSAECMGWISSDVIPQNLDEGWFNITAEDIRDDVTKIGKKARIWGKASVERESNVLGDADPSDVLPADFIIPHEATYPNRPPSNIRIDLKSLNLRAPVSSVNTTPSIERLSPFSESNSPPETETYIASLAFSMSHDATDQDVELNFSLSNDVYFLTAHPCAASSYVKYLKSPSSPTIQQIDVGGHDFNGKPSSSAHITGHPLHRFYTYTAIHLAELLTRSASTTLEDLIKGTPSHGRSSSVSSRTSFSSKPQRVLVIDCITGFAPPRSPDMLSLSRMSSISSSFALEPTNTPPVQLSTPQLERRPSTARSGASKFERIEPPPPPAPETKMQLGTQRRQFGSDLEILVRAFCAEKGWNAIISRRRRACLACAIREAGALGWRVVIRVD
ncbi:hypothetical protein E0Z10_g3873 [Xylaria hypoxylon]|uniref:Uncharacterized protein n=1 Tax=Xylaria hypoxylon TaxID=37992 RepID=A0A4Z0YY58_9PEZI|nr:hypothetical protein E0Z10_g3873 [Xylaria hypoxylon]